MDLVLLLVACMLAEAGHFAIRQGRHLISADSVQYVDGARALLDGTEQAHFDFRKPGYSLVLAATALMFGNMGWAAILVNHFFQALLPIAAYGLGKVLLSRGAAWLAAVFVLALLQVHYRADRIMSEAVYTTLATFGLAAAAYAVRRSPTPAGVGASIETGGLRARNAALSPADPVVPDRGTFSPAPMLLAGTLLGAAWLLRAGAIAAIGGVLCTILVGRRRAALVALPALIVPILGFVLLECALNHRFAGEFRPGTGTAGPSLLMRARAYLNLPLSETPAAETCTALLPERTAAEAFAAHRSDVWVAWHRARHERKMSEWEINALMGSAGLDALRNHPQVHLSNAMRIFVRYLLRRTDGPPLTRTPDHQPQSPILPCGEDLHTAREDQPFIPWALPLRPSSEAADLVTEMLHAAEKPAPFGQSGYWADLRYAVMHPLVVDVFGVFRHVATIWPGFALILCPLLGLNRRVCWMLAVAYLLDAAIVANFTSSDNDLTRYGYVWLATDATLVAGLVAGMLSRLRRTGPHGPEQSGHTGFRPETPDHPST